MATLKGLRYAWGPDCPLPGTTGIWGAGSASGLLRHEPVADPGNGVNVLRLLGIALDLLAQPVDVGVDRPRLDLDLVAPDLAQQLAAADDLARLGPQQRKQVELGVVHVDFLPLPPDLAAVQVDDQAGELEARLGLLLGYHLLAAAEVGPHPGQELSHLEGLGDIVVRPHFEAHDHVDGVVLGGEHDHGHLGPVGPQLPAHIHATDAGQVEVEQDQVRFRLLQHLHAFLAGLRFNQVEVLTDARHPNDFAGRRVVLNHQDGFRKGHGSRRYSFSRKLVTCTMNFFSSIGFGI